MEFALEKVATVNSERAGAINLEIVDDKKNRYKEEVGLRIGRASIRPQSQNLAQFNLSKNRLGRALFRVAAGLPFPCSLPSQIGGSQSHPLKTLLSKSQFPQFLFPQSNSIRFRLFAVPLFTANSHSRPICKPMSGKVPTPILTQIIYDTFHSSVPNSAKIFKVFYKLHLWSRTRICI